MEAIFAMPELDPGRALTPTELENAAETLLVYGRKKKKDVEEILRCHPNAASADSAAIGRRADELSAKMAELDPLDVFPDNDFILQGDMPPENVGLKLLGFPDFLSLLKDAENFKTEDAFTAAAAPTLPGGYDERQKSSLLWAIFICVHESFETLREDHFLLSRAFMRARYGVPMEELRRLEKTFTLGESVTLRMLLYILLNDYGLL